MKRDVYLFADALGWDLVEETGFMSAELPHRKAVEMQFGYSCSAMPAILSGTQPGENGHLSLFRYAPGESPFGLLAAAGKFMKPESFWNRGRVRNLLSRVVGRMLGYTGYFRLYSVPFSRIGYYDYCEKRDIFAKGGLAPAANLRDAWEGQGAKFHVSDWRLGDEANVEAAAEAIRGGAEKVFAYTAGLDAIRHDHPDGARSAEVRAKLEWYAGAVRRLMEACAEAGGEWRLTVLSDHGMTPLARTVDARGAVEATGLRFGVDYGACWDSTMARFTYHAREAREKIREAMGKFAGDGDWLDEEAERSAGIWREDRAFGDEIFLMRPGVQISPCDMGAKPLRGMHGYATKEAHSLAAAMSTHPLPQNLSHVVQYRNLMVQGNWKS